MSKIESFDESHTIVLGGTGSGAASRVLKTGDLIGGSYKLKSLLGRGGMGYVFCAEHTIIKRDYALKMLAPEQLTEANLRRFEIEGKAIANLDHPNIVKVYNMGIDGGDCPFYVMDLLDGTPLSDCISAKKDIAFEESLDILGQIAAGLGYAHSKGIVHRDVKPSNIILLAAQNGRICVKILDFGIAKLLPSANLHTQSQTATGEVFGSPFYMSPEQCMGSQVDHRSDIYSLGCTFFEALCGKPPYQGDNAMETVMMHQNKPVPSILETRPEKHWPQAVDLLLTKMMAKRPEHRYQSMEQLIHDIARVKQGKAIGKGIAKAPTPDNQAYQAPDPSLGNTVAPEVLEGGINDGGHSGHHRVRLFQILGLVLLVGIVFCAWCPRPSLQQTACVQQKTYLAGASGPSRKENVTNLSPGSPQAPDLAGFDVISPEELKKRLAQPQPYNRFALDDVKLTDKSFELIAGASWIHDLSLNNCDIDNNSLGRLARLRLSAIHLYGSTFNDLGAEKLSKCQGLVDISACLTKLSDQGVRKLAAMKGLKNLSVSGSRITDRSLRDLANANDLCRLDLRYTTQITDQGLSALGRSHLQHLMLESVPVGDAGMVHISKIASLREVILKKTNVTIDGIKELCKNKGIASILVEQCPNLKEGDHKLQSFPAVRFN